MKDSKRDTDVKNRLLGSVEEGTFERIALTMYIIICKIDRQSRFDA